MPGATRENEALAGSHEASVALALAIAAVVAIRAFAAAVNLLARGWRLKP